GAGRHRAAPARRPAPLPHGPRGPGRDGGVDRPRDRPVRLRAAHPLRPSRHDPLHRRPLQPEASGERRRQRAARRRLRLPGVRPLVPGLPAAPARRRRAHRPAAHHDPQRVVDPPPGRGGPRRHPARHPRRRAVPGPSGVRVTSPAGPCPPTRRRPRAPPDADRPLTGQRRSPPMMRGRMKRSGLRPMWVMVVLTVGLLAGVLAAGWSPKLGLDLEGGFAVTLQPIEEASSDVLDQSIEVIRSRVDALGVAEPEITRQGSTIEVSLPGVTDRDRARELVGQTAELRFRPVLSSFPGSLEDLLGDLPEGDDGAGTDAGDDAEEETDDGAEVTDTTDTTEVTDGGDAAEDEAVEGQAGAGPATPFQDETTTTADG